MGGTCWQSGEGSCSGACVEAVPDLLHGGRAGRSRVSALGFLGSRIHLVFLEPFIFNFEQELPIKLYMMGGCTEAGGAAQRAQQHALLTLTVRLSTRVLDFFPVETVRSRPAASQPAAFQPAAFPRCCSSLRG
jgi:hypothetical protein